MDSETIKSYLYLNAVLPQLEEVVAFDQEAQQLCKGWNCSIQMYVSNGPGVVLTFKDGKCESKLGTVGLPSIAMLLPNAQAVNKMFEKKGFVLPIIWWGIWRFGTLGKFTKLTEYIEKYLRPTDEMLKDPKVKAFCTRMQLMVAAYGLKAVGEHDMHCVDVVKRAPNGPMEIRVAPDGPVVHIIKEGGSITPVKGPAKDPMVVMKINGMDLAYDMLNGNVDFMEALGMCRIQLSGHIGMAEDLALVLESIAKYLE